MEPIYDARYFEENYRSYELQNPPRKLAFYRGLLERTLGGGRAPRILEVGCAFGRFLSALDPGWQHFGIDVSEFAIGACRQVLPDARLAVASGAAIPFAGEFDAIVAFDVLEHIAALDRVRDSLHSKLAPGGYLIFVVPVYDGPTGPLIRLLDRDATHVHKRSRRFWLEWVGAGLQVVEWWGIYRYLLPGGCTCTGRPAVCATSLPP